MGSEILSRGTPGLAWKTRACPWACLTKTEKELSVTPRVPCGQTVVFTQAFLLPCQLYHPSSALFLSQPCPLVKHQRCHRSLTMLIPFDNFCISVLISLPHLSRHDPDLLFDGSQTARCVWKCHQSDSRSSCIISVRRRHSRRLSAKSTVTAFSAFILCFTSSVIAERYSSLSGGFPSLLFATR